MSEITNRASPIFGKKGRWLPVGSVAQWPSAGYLSQGPWVWLPVAPAFFWVLCNVKGLYIRAVATEIVSLIWHANTIGLWTTRNWRAVHRTPSLAVILLTIIPHQCSTCVYMLTLIEHHSLRRQVTVLLFCPPFFLLIYCRHSLTHPTSQ